MQIDWNTYLDSMFRWAHILSGIAWIGLLYFFNLINGPFQGKLDAAAKKIVNPELLPRTLWWFRWSAMSTLAFGLILFFWVYMKNNNMRTLDGELSGRALYIMIGMTLGIIMWFNVWFIIWPCQRQILRGLKAGTPAPPEVGKKALLFSRTNAYLSGPMLALMVLAPHYSNFSWGVFVLSSAIGVAVIYAMIKSSAKIGTDV